MADEEGGGLCRGELDHIGGHGCDLPPLDPIAGSPVHTGSEVLMKRGWVVVLLATAGVARAQSPQISQQLQSLGQSFAPGQVPASQVFAGMAPENQENPFFV